MKTIGLLGGMSWESTVSYYRTINEEIKSRLGKLHSGKIVLYSVDFQEIEVLQHQGRWDDATVIMIDGAKRVQAGGANFLVICTNTMHRMVDEIQSQIEIPVLHIADATASAVKQDGITKVGLLGTRFTMEEDFYRGRLVRQHSLDVIVPDESDRNVVHSVIYDELCLGKILDSSRRSCAEIIEKLVSKGAQGIILGCTEIALLVSPENSLVPLFDTAGIHALGAVSRALE